ncbi:MAG: efflux RND transporter periplasmic adaptor subunit [Gemmataceae bacterium]|nr:efflux RND transporter periplasmic adaptor subunit [Gemmataceae bacterium]
MLGWLLRAVPTVLVLAGLAGAAYWGHATGWDFSRRTGGAGPPADIPPAGGDRPVVRIEAAAPGAGSPLPGLGVRVEFASARAVEAAGIDITPVWRAALTEQAAAAGEVTFDQARVARVPARAGGVTRRVFKAAGDSVRAGDVLALIDAAAVGKAKAEFQQALVQARLRERTRDDLAGAKAAASPAAVREAEAAVKEAAVRVLAAAQALANLGLPVNADDYRDAPPAEAAKRLRHLGAEDATEGLAPADATTNLLPVRSPLAGVVLSADVVAGETAEAGKALFVVVDPSRVWVTLHVGAEDARRAAAGQKAFFRPDGGTREYPATVVWVGTAADEATRTVPVRAEADNAAGALRASTLGRGRVVFREEPKAIVIPHEAVHPFCGRAVVFVRDPDYLKADGPKAFHARSVTTGGRDDRHTEVLAGLSPGEIVATKGSGVLLAELTHAAADR